MRAWLHTCKQNKQDFFQLSLIPSDQESGKSKGFGKQLLGTALYFGEEISSEEGEKWFWHPVSPGDSKAV